MMIHLVGEKEHNSTVVGVEVRTAPLATEPWTQTFGVIHRGFEVIRLGWPNLDHVSSVRQSDEDGKSKASLEPANIF